MRAFSLRFLYAGVLMWLSIFSGTFSGSCQSLPADRPNGNGDDSPDAPPTVQTSHGPLKIIRKFIYPSHFEPPAIPSAFDDGRLPDEQAVAILTRKLWDTVVPKISFHGTRFEDAVNFLRRESVRLDDQPSAAPRGVPITVQWHLPLGGLPRAESPTGDRLAADILVTLSRENVPLMTAVTDLAMQAGMKFDVDRHGALLLYPVPNASDFVTMEFRVPRGFEDTLRLYDPPGDGTTATGEVIAAPPSPPKAFPFLQSQGVQFRPGTAAAYLKATSKLIVRNTPEDAALVQALVEKAWEQSDPPRPAKNP